LWLTYPKLAAEQYIACSSESSLQLLRYALWLWRKGQITFENTKVSYKIAVQK